MDMQPADRRAANLPGRRHLLGTLIDFKATGAMTDNAYSLVEVTTAPGAFVPPHVQLDDDEAFYVLEGSFEFMHDGRMSLAGPGSYLFVRRGEPHGFRNPGAAPARMLIINSPGGLHEAFFREAGDPVAPGAGFPPPAAPDMPRLIAAARRNGIEFLPPEAAA